MEYVRRTFQGQRMTGGDSRRQIGPPRFVVFEGVDGAGKTSLAKALENYYRAIVPDSLLYAGAFPGSASGTLGEWVYRLHHSRVEDLDPASIAPPALQLLHVAAHVDAIVTRIGPTLSAGGYVVLDRYWWSTYAYARDQVAPKQAWGLVTVEYPFWEELPRPEIVYVTRLSSLKAHEIDQDRHDRLTAHYSEVIEREQADGARVHLLANDGEFKETWTALLATLDIADRDVE